MMPTMCAELSAHARIGAVRQRRRPGELFRRAALIRADVDVYRPAAAAPAGSRPPERLAVHTSRRSDAG